MDISYEVITDKYGLKIVRDDFDAKYLGVYAKQTLQNHLTFTDAEYRRASASVKREKYGRWQAHARAIEKELEYRLTQRNTPFITEHKDLDFKEKAKRKWHNWIEVMYK